LVASGKGRAQRRSAAAKEYLRHQGREQHEARTKGIARQSTREYFFLSFALFVVNLLHCAPC
jgi:hypothetical protein